MARHIDAEALTDYMLERYDELCEKHGDYDHYTTGYGDAIDVIEVAPTADVVPKSEVEEIIRENESLAKTVNEASELIRKLRSKVEKSKTDVAREIFAEIENLVRRDHPCYSIRADGVITESLIMDGDMFAELKKKYTEDSNDVDQH